MGLGGWIGKFGSSEARLAGLKMAEPYHPPPALYRACSPKQFIGFDFELPKLHYTNLSSSEIYQTNLQLVLTCTSLLYSSIVISYSNALFLAHTCITILEF